MKVYTKHTNIGDNSDQVCKCEIIRNKNISDLFYKRNIQTRIYKKKQKIKVTCHAAQPAPF